MGPSQNRLRGSSETVPGEAYTLWIYVPKGMTVAQVRATSTWQRSVPEKHKLMGDALRVSFQGLKEPVDWEVDFATKAAK